MKTMLIGANGQLGTALRRRLAGADLAALTHADIEIADYGSVAAAFERHQPEVVVNTAAFVRVDDCEGDADLAFRVNALGARNVAVAAQEHGARLVHLSTDYVFGGGTGRAAPYTEFDAPAPINTYGRSKLAGEELVQRLCARHFIVRTSGLFGGTGSTGKGGNFVATMLRLAREQDQLRVVDDQVFSPTHAADLADVVASLAGTSLYGTYHVTNGGSCSWHEFATEILAQAGIDTPVVPVPSREFPRPAPRPGFSVLDNYQLRLAGLGQPRPWQEALGRYLVEVADRPSG